MYVLKTFMDIHDLQIQKDLKVMERSALSVFIFMEKEEKSPMEEIVAKEWKKYLQDKALVDHIIFLSVDAKTAFNRIKLRDTDYDRATTFESLEVEHKLYEEYYMEMKEKLQKRTSDTEIWRVNANLPKEGVFRLVDSIIHAIL